MKNLKMRVARYFLKKLNEKQGEKENVSLTKANRVIVLLPQNKKNRDKAEAWLKKLKNQWNVDQVDSFFFQYRKPGKKDPTPDKREINRTHLNWYLKPQHKGLTGSYKKKYDLLIDLDREHPIPHQFIAAEIEAKMKVGLQVRHYPKGFDFVLKTKEEDSIEYITQQIEKYLSIFEPGKKEAYAK
jgi:hypothetical protein